MMFIREWMRDVLCLYGNWVPIAWCTDWCCKNSREYNIWICDFVLEFSEICVCFVVSTHSLFIHNRIAITGNYLELFVNQKIVDHHHYDISPNTISSWLTPPCLQNTDDPSIKAGKIHSISFVRHPFHHRRQSERQRTIIKRARGTIKVPRMPFQLTAHWV